MRRLLESHGPRSCMVQAQMVGVKEVRGLYWVPAGFSGDLPFPGYLRSRKLVPDTAASTLSPPPVLLSPVSCQPSVTLEPHSSSPTPGDDAHHFLEPNFAGPIPWPSRGERHPERLHRAGWVTGNGHAERRDWSFSRRASPSRPLQPDRPRRRTGLVAEAVQWRCRYASRPGDIARGSTPSRPGASNCPAGPSPRATRVLRETGVGGGRVP